MRISELIQREFGDIRVVDDTDRGPADISTLEYRALGQFEETTQLEKPTIGEPILLIY